MDTRQPYPNLPYHPLFNALVLGDVFQRLNIEDLKSCRRVCKYWKAEVRSEILMKSKCKLWANCYEAPMDTNSINSFFLHFYNEFEVDYIPTSTFHIINPGCDAGKRFIDIFGANMKCLILEFQDDIVQNPAEFGNAFEDDGSRDLTEDDLKKRQIHTLLNFAELKNLEELRIEHGRYHFDNFSHNSWAECQTIGENETVILNVKALTLVGRHSVHIFQTIFQICPNVENLHIVSNDLENVPSGVFSHLRHESRASLQMIKFTRCSISLETLNNQQLMNIKHIELDECEVIEVNSLKLLHQLFTSFANLLQIVVKNTYSGDTLWSLTLKHPSRRN